MHRRRISIIGVDIDPKRTKEIIQNKDFLLCEYHSNFPQFVVDQIKKIPHSQLSQRVSMKSCANQWIIAKIEHEQRSKSQIIYWSTSLPQNNESSHHPNSPTKCHLIELQKCFIYDSDAEIADIADIEHIHLLYPSASSFCTLKPHRPYYPNQQTTMRQTNNYNNPFMPYSFNKDILSRHTQMHKNNSDDAVLCPLFPSSSSRSLTSIFGILFLSKDHKSLYVLPHDHVTSISHQKGTESTYSYQTNRNIAYHIPLFTKTDQYNERIVRTQVLPQPRVGSHHSV